MVTGREPSLKIILHRRYVGLLESSFLGSLQHHWLRPLEHYLWSRASIGFGLGGYRVWRRCKVFFLDRKTEHGPVADQLHGNCCIAALLHIFNVRDWQQTSSLAS